MSLLVADLLTDLSDQVGAMFAVSGLDGGPTSRLLMNALATSARELGVTLANPLAVVDADLLGIVQDDVSQLEEVAELRALERALNSYQQVSMRQAEEGNEAHQIAITLERTVERKAAYVKERYGIGRGSLQAGAIDLGFAERYGPFWDSDCGGIDGNPY